MNRAQQSAPRGEVAIQTVAMPRDTNANGDIFGGWLMSQMDIAGAITAARVAKGRVATVAVDQMSFIAPVSLGSVVCCYVEVLGTGRTSIRTRVEVWVSYPDREDEVKVTEGAFTFVAIDEAGRPRPVSAAE